jgi:hypothetical protein
MDKNIACYKCNYLGHKARDCRYMNEDVPMPTTVWRRKEIPNNEDCRIALTAEECKEEYEWYIDNGCSSHMTGDQDKFIILKRNVGRLVVVIDVNPSHGFWTTRLIKVFGHEGQCTCIYNTHEWIVYIMLFLVVCGTSRGSSWLRRNEFLKMTK